MAALLDAIAEAGADRLGRPGLRVRRPVAGRLLATRAALADARRRADDAAATQGLRITGVRSVTLAPQTLADFGGEDDAASGAGGSLERAAATPTQISPGLQQFTERVRVVYTAAPL